MTNSTKAHIAGVGMIPFVKPGTSDEFDVMAAAAAKLALEDAGVEYSAIQEVFAGYVFGDSTCGQKAVYHLGHTGIPVTNVNNNCSTGSTALYHARRAIEYGAADCVIAIGFEQMNPGALGKVFQDRSSPFDDFDKLCNELMGVSDVPSALRCFGGAGQSHMQKYGTTLEDFAKVRAKASRHAAHNPLALFRNVVSAEDVLQSHAFWPGVMTKLMACPPTCGAASAILVSSSFAKKHGLRTDVVISAQSMTTDTPSTFAGKDMMSVAGYDMSKKAGLQVFEAAGIGPADVDVVELHDCFAHNELITYEALGLCGEGEAQRYIADGDNTYGGAHVTNPSGGLLSKGHPLGATGLAQCFELTKQLRGEAGERQVEDARVALQHNIGLGGACVVTLYEKHA
ncbi:MAG: lipid-transfer protein [Parvibaculaceae bacterium]